MTPATVDMVAPGITRDTSKCILCGRCIERCKEAQGIGILGFENRGFQDHRRPGQQPSALPKCRAYSAANASKSARPAL
jgi:NADP-reducing hydrogenase subunit HndD